MNNKQQILTLLKDIFNRWDELLTGMSEEQITAPQSPSDWSIKDEIAHLWGWQQRTLARSEAALHNREPAYPAWPGELDPDLEENLDRINTWIYETNRDKPWSSVYADWRTQFLRILELSEQLPENDLLDPGRYKWMGEYSLLESLEGTHEHHAEHLEELLARLG
ncbi:MAG TPA: ClbS/DfsB family four-helix bundle protein [Chloroflexia bacterium]|nr:ClbS/DfsB family four-helix bundle protein [Chloroflexia bacterium]